MKIKATYNWETPKDETVAEYVERKLTERCHTRGTLEDIQFRSENTAKALGRLMQLLAARGLLSARDVVEIAENAQREAEFIR